jgi:hypothetical protein
VALLRVKPIKIPELGCPLHDASIVMKGGSIAAFPVRKNHPMLFARSVRSFRSPTASLLAFFCLLCTAAAQRHDLGSSPPTAPPPKQIVVPQPMVPDPANVGLGPIQFFTVNYIVSAPQALILQLQSSDDRMRTSGLAAVGAPSQYLIHGHVPFPLSLRLDFVALGNTAELDAIVTVELPQHLLSAILMPQNDEWHRIATLLYPTSFSETATPTPSTFLRTDRSLLDRAHYAAIFHAGNNGPNADFIESEAHLQILKGRAVVTVSFPSTERSCDPTRQHPCDLTERWFQSETIDPEHRFLLVTATGHVKPQGLGDSIGGSETFETAHLRTFTCQPFVFSETTLHFESTAPPMPCTGPQHEPSNLNSAPPRD